MQSGWADFWPAGDDLDNADILTLRWVLASWMRSAQAGSQLAGRNLDGLALGWLYGLALGCLYGLALGCLYGLAPGWLDAILMGWLSAGLT